MNFGLKVWFVSLHLETLNFTSVYVKHLVCFQNVKHFCTPWSLLALSLHKMCPNTEFFLVRIQENTDQKKLRIWTLFTHCLKLFQFQYIHFKLFIQLFSILQALTFLKQNDLSLRVFTSVPRQFKLCSVSKCCQNNWLKYLWFGLLELQVHLHTAYLNQ